MDYRPLFERISKTDINLIPANGNFTGSYSCTWWNQCPTAEQLGLTGTGLSEWRDALNQDSLFETERFYHPIPQELRNGLIFLLDDGWDIPIGTPNDAEHRHLYGAVDPDPVKFSRFGSDPKERLKGMSDKAKDMGYAGLGLWISPQLKGEGPETFTDDEERAYWEERAKWCNYAGVLYWKVDWGTHDYDDNYRKMMTECAHKFAPDLLVEHAVIQKPCTHQNYSENFASERPERVKTLMKFSDAYRTYDLLDPFDKVCTLQRAHEALICNVECSGKGLVNGENMYIINAALGLTSGIMNYNKDAENCILWHRIAPPFGINKCNYSYSEERLEDSLFFETEICGWAPCIAQTVYESAPAIMSRGCPLPKVDACGDSAPFVIASKNPITRAYSVATLKRTVDPNVAIYFPSDVTVDDADLDCPVGIFGVFNKLTINFNGPIDIDCRILAQPMQEKNAYDITELVTIRSNSLTLDGKLLRYIGKSTRDQYEPALILRLTQK